MATIKVCDCCEKKLVNTEEKSYYIQIDEVTGYTDRKNIANIDLCSSCWKSLESFIGQLKNASRKRSLL